MIDPTLLQLGVGGALAVILVTIVLKLVFDYMGTKKNNVYFDKLEAQLIARVNSFENRFDIKMKDFNSKIDCIKKENVYTGTNIKTLSKNLDVVKDVSIKSWELHDHHVDGIPVWYFPKEVKEKITNIATDFGKQTMRIRDMEIILSDIKNKSSRK